MDVISSAKEPETIAGRLEPVSRPLAWSPARIVVVLALHAFYVIYIVFLFLEHRYDEHFGLPGIASFGLFHATTAGFVLLPRPGWKNHLFLGYALLLTGIVATLGISMEGYWDWHFVGLILSLVYILSVQALTLTAALVAWRAYGNRRTPFGIRKVLLLTLLVCALIAGFKFVLTMVLPGKENVRAVLIGGGLFAIMSSALSLVLPWMARNLWRGLMAIPLGTCLHYLPIYTRTVPPSDAFALYVVCGAILVAMGLRALWGPSAAIFKSKPTGS